MLVKERLAPQIMEGLTIHLNGHLEINAHLLAAVFFFFNMIGMSVYYILYVYKLLCCSNHLSGLQ